MGSSSAQRLDEYGQCQRIVQICKDEIDPYLPDEVIASMDNGSPWGRALLRAWQFVREQTDERAVGNRLRERTDEQS